MKKPKFALYWCSSCGGCEESVLDMAEDLLYILENSDIMFWPVALDYKFSDLQRLEDGELTAAFINGAIRMEDQENAAKLLRKKSQIVVAHGTCAHLGGVYALSNFFSRDSIIERCYRNVPGLFSNSSLAEEFPSGRDFSPKLSGFHEHVKSLDQVIDVDYYIPGCPATPELMKKAFRLFFENKLPPKGTVLAEKQALCKF